MSDITKYGMVDAEALEEEVEDFRETLESLLIRVSQQSKDIDELGEALAQMSAPADD